MLLFSQNLLNSFQKVNLIGRKSHICIQPLKWNGNLERFSPQSHKLRKFILIFHILTLAGISFVQLFLAVKYSPKNQSKSIAFASKCQNCFWFSAFSVGASFYIGLLKKEEEIVSLWNGVINLEKRFGQVDFNLRQETNENFVRKIKFVKIFCKFQAEVSAAASVTAGLAAAALPSFSTNFLFYFLYENTSENIFLEIAERVIFFLLHSFAFHLVTRIAVWYIVQVAIVVNCLIAGLFRFRRMTVESLQRGFPIKTPVRFYRQLQILTGLFGEIHRKIMAHTLFAAVSVQIICVFMLTKLLNGEKEIKNHAQNLAMAGFYGVVAVEASIVVLGLYGFMADLHYRSVRIKNSIVVEEGRAKTGKWRLAWMRLHDKERSERKLPVWKTLKTFPHLKVVLGSGNFLEKTSPLKFEDFAMVATANLLLIH